MVGKSVVVRKVNGEKRKVINPIRRIVAAWRILSHGITADAFAEYVQRSEDSVLVSLERFCEEMVKELSPKLLPHLNDDGVKRILSIKESRQFSDYLGRTYCQHLE